MPPSEPDEELWLTPDERGAWLACAALAVQLPAALDAQLQRDADLSFLEYMVLAMLSEEPDRTLQMSHLATRVSASLSRLSHTASRMERLGLLTRVRRSGPGRATDLVLTDLGHESVVAAAPGHVATVRSLLVGALDATQLEALRAVGEGVRARIADSGLGRAPRG